MVFVWIFLVELVVLFFLARFLQQSLSLLFYRFFRSEGITIRLLAFLFLPGVIVHELSHAFTAGILFVRVGSMEFLPKAQGDRVKLGSVEIEHTGMIRRAFVGLAPLLVGGLLLILSLLYAFSYFPLPFEIPTVWKWVIEFYIVFEISNTMFSSRKDTEGAIGLLVTIVLLVLSFFLGSLFAHSSLFVQVLNMATSLVTAQVSNIFQQIDTLLLVPLGLDLLILSFARLFLRK